MVLVRRLIYELQHYSECRLLYYLRQAGCVLLGVCLSVCRYVCLFLCWQLRVNTRPYWSDFHENITKDVSVDSKELIKFLKSSASAS